MNQASRRSLRILPLADRVTFPRLFNGGWQSWFRMSGPLTSGERETRKFLIVKSYYTEIQIEDVVVIPLPLSEVT